MCLKHISLMWKKLRFSNFYILFATLLLHSVISFLLFFDLSFLLLLIALFSVWIWISTIYPIKMKFKMRFSISRWIFHIKIDYVAKRFMDSIDASRGRKNLIFDFTTTFNVARPDIFSLHNVFLFVSRGKIIVFFLSFPCNY